MHDIVDFLKSLYNAERLLELARTLLGSSLVWSADPPDKKAEKPRYETRQDHDPGYINYLKCDPMLSDLRADPRYQSMLAQLNLPP